MPIEEIVKRMRMDLEGNEYVFPPTTTTIELCNQVDAQPGEQGLDLGCGAGPITIALAEKGVHMVGSDISEPSCEKAREYVKIYGVQDLVDIRCGDMFEPVKGMKFDFAVGDVAGIARLVALLSGWYKEKMHMADDTGTAPTRRMIREVKDYLKDGGRFYFAASSLSRYALTLKEMNDHLGDGAQLVMQKGFVLCDELKANIKKLEELKDQGLINFRQRGSRLLWDLYVWKYVKHMPALQ